MTKLFFSNIAFPILTDGTQSPIWKEKNNTYVLSGDLHSFGRVMEAERGQAVPETVSK